MTPHRRDGSSGVKLAGLVVAGVAFFLTRFTVTFAAAEPLAFLLIGVLPLVLGLSVAVFGVALAVGAHTRAYARTVAVWSLAGTGSMAALVVLTLVGLEPASGLDLTSIRSKTYLSNFLIGGCFGGTLTGVYAARNRRERVEQRDQAKRMAVLNRVFRDRVLNSITAIRGRVDLLRAGGRPGERTAAIDVVANQSAALEETVEEIQHLTRSSRSTPLRLHRVDLAECVRSCAECARDRYPDAEIVFESASAPSVWANGLLEHALDRLVENAVVHGDASPPRVELAVRRDGDVATVAVSDNGPGLPAEQRAMLDGGTVEEFDDPTTGFGLNLVTLLVESFHGRIGSTVTDRGTTIEAAFPVARADDPSDVADRPRSRGVSTPELVLAGAAALLAGAVMGVVGNAMTGLVPVIGVLYGIQDPVVGWVTHEFHSVVFGVVYVALLTGAPKRYRTTLVARLAVALIVAVAWGLFLWLFAAGVVTPVWLRLVGVPASVPNVSETALVTHLVWALTLGSLYVAGSEVLSERFPAVDR